MPDKKPKKKTPGVHVNLVLVDELFRKVKALADRQHFTVSNMVRVMILDYLEQRRGRELDRIVTDLQVHYARLSGRLATWEHTELLIDAVLRKDWPGATAQANALRRLHDDSEEMQRHLEAGGVR